MSGLSCGMQDLFVAGLFVVAQGLLSSCDAWAPEHAGSVLAARGLSCPTACGISAPQLGIKPTSPALEGGFSTTGPPGKSPTLSGLFFFPPNLFIYIFLAVLGLHRCVRASSSCGEWGGGYSSLWCAGFSLRWLLLLQTTGSRHPGFSSCGARAQ